MAAAESSTRCRLSAPVRSRMDGSDFPYWFFPIERPHAGPVLGNSRSGLLVWGSGKVLELTFSDASLWDHDGGAEWNENQTFKALRAALESGDSTAVATLFPQVPKSPQTIPIGRLSLVLKDGLSLEAAKLDTRTGSVEIFVGGRVGRLRSPHFTIGLDRETGAVFVSGDVRSACESITPRPAWESQAVREALEKRGFKSPSRYPDGFAQPLPHDPAAALAFTFGESDGNLYAATSRAGSPTSITAASRAIDAAREAAKQAASIGAKQLFDRTSEFWKEFWENSPAIDIPNRLLASIFEFGLYKFGAATAGKNEPQSTPCPLQGPWIEDYQLPPWGADYHFNVNVEECYWPAFQSGHVDRVRPLLDMVSAWLPRLKQNAKLYIGVENGVLLPHAVDDTGKAMDTGFWTGATDHGSAMWVADLMWQYFRWSADKAFLRKQAMPFMKAAFDTFWAMLDNGPDGSLRLPVGVSPEFRGASPGAWGVNASFQLAGAHRLAENLLDAASKLREQPDARWQTLLDHLPKSSLVDVGGKKHLALWEGLDLPETHRHHSHFAAIFPFDSIDCDSPEWAEIVDHSFRNWMWRGPALWTGWSFPWASILHSRVGNGGMAELLLEIWNRAFVNEGGGTLLDTCMSGVSLYGMDGVQHGPYPQRPEIMQLEAGLGAAAAVMEMLMHEKRGVLHIFRAVPQRWREASFSNMAAPGCVRVSARYSNRVVTNVVFKTGNAPARIKLKNPWGAACASVLSVEGAAEKTLAPAPVLELRLPKLSNATLRRFETTSPCPSLETESTTTET